MQGRARRKSDQGVCWQSGNSHCVLWCGWSRFRGNQPFSPWFQFPHALQPLPLCDSLETFWYRPPASCQRAEWCEPEDKKKKGDTKKSEYQSINMSTSTCRCFWTAQQMPAFSLFTTSHHRAWCSNHKNNMESVSWDEFFLPELTLLYLAFGCRLFSTASTHSCSLDESM